MHSSPLAVTAAALALPQPLREQLAHWAHERYPREACGLLLGRREATRTTIVRALEARNLAPRDVHDRFDLDPADHLAAEKLARESALEVAGIWHSHPDHPARPSTFDRQHAWHAWSYVIVSVLAGVPDELRAWCLEGERFVEQPLSP